MRSVQEGLGQFATITECVVFAAEVKQLKQGLLQLHEAR
jgi:hypothetical protein